MNFTAPTNTHTPQKLLCKLPALSFLLANLLYRQTYTSGLAGSAPATRKHINLFYAKVLLNSTLYIARMAR